MAKVDLGEVVGNIAQASVQDLLGIATTNPGEYTTAQILFNVLETKSRDVFDLNNVPYCTNFLSGQGLKPGRWRVYMADGTAGNAPEGGAVGGEVTVIVADGKTFQIFLDNANRYYCNIFTSTAPTKNWVKIGGASL